MSGDVQAAGYGIHAYHSLLDCSFEAWELVYPKQAQYRLICQGHLRYRGVDFVVILLKSKALWIQSFEKTQSSLVPWGILHLKQKLYVLVQSDLRYGITGNKKRATCFLTLPQNVLNGVLPSTFKPVLQQTRLLQITRILTSDWINLGGSHTIHGHHRTCCKPRLAWGRTIKKN